MREIDQKTQTQDSTIPNTSSGANQKQHIRNELPNVENEYAKVPSKPTETLSQEQQTNQENLKRIMNRVKTTLPLLRNIEWRTLKTEKKEQIKCYLTYQQIIYLSKMIESMQGRN